MADSNLRDFSENGSSHLERSPKRFKRVHTLGIIKCHGGGVRVLLTSNDSDDAWSVVKGILTCKADGSQFCRKFKGYKHDGNVLINGIQFGRFSYRWLNDSEEATPDALAELFRSCKHVCKRPNDGYTQGNIKFHVHVLAVDTVSMSTVYSTTDIIKHCTSEVEKFAMWRLVQEPHRQETTYFWDGDHASLRDTIATLHTDQASAPTVNGITF